MIAASLGGTIPFRYILMAVPCANIISTLPLSWMGLGLRENVYVFFFVPAYFTPELAVTCALVWFLAMVLAGAGGGLFAVLSGDLRMLTQMKQRPAGAPPGSAENIGSP